MPRVEVDDIIRSKLLEIRTNLGSTDKAVAHLNSKGANLTKNRFYTLVHRPRSNRHWFITAEDYKAITGSDPENTFEGQTEFIRKMIRWYTYFTHQIPSKLMLIEEELGLGEDALNRFVHHGKVKHFRMAPMNSYSIVESYFFNWYLQEGFRTRKEIADFLDEMETISQELPIFDRVPREKIEQIVTEVSKASGIPVGSLWPPGYSRKDPASRKTFRFSDYQKLVRIREEIKKGLTDKVISYDNDIQYIIPFVVQLRDEFGFDYGKTISVFGREIKRWANCLASYEFRTRFEKGLTSKLTDYLGILRVNRKSGLRVGFDHMAIRIRVTEAATDAKKNTGRDYAHSQIRSAI